MQPVLSSCAALQLVTPSVYQFDTSNTIPSAHPLTLQRRPNVDCMSGFFENDLATVWNETDRLRLFVEHFLVIDPSIELQQEDLCQTGGPLSVVGDGEVWTFQSVF